MIGVWVPDTTSARGGRGGNKPLAAESFNRSRAEFNV